jgi:hypothetical protein
MLVNGVVISMKKLLLMYLILPLQQFMCLLDQLEQMKQQKIYVIIICEHCKSLIRRIRRKTTNHIMTIYDTCKYQEKDFSNIYLVKHSLIVLLQTYAICTHGIKGCECV